METNSVDLSKPGVEPDEVHASSDVDRGSFQHNVYQPSTHAPAQVITGAPISDPAQVQSETNYNPTAQLDTITGTHPNLRDSKSKIDMRSNGTDAESLNIPSAHSNLFNTEAGKMNKPPDLTPSTFEQSVRRQSASSGNTSPPFSMDETASRNNETDVTSMRSEKVVTSPEVKGFRFKGIIRVQFKLKTAVQSTAISSTCETIALIKDSNFQIYSIPKTGSNGRITLKSCGFNDGRFGSSMNTLKKTVDQPSNPSPVYVLGAMSDTVLCIASTGNCVDIRETSTGRRIRTVTFPNLRCRVLTMSPNGRLLAVGMETGEILIYGIVDINATIPTEPVVIKSSYASRSVNCIAFSPDLTLMSYCDSNNITYTYSLAASDIREMAKYNRKLSERVCRAPYYGVTCLA
jgi:hypothetical protein